MTNLANTIIYFIRYVEISKKDEENSAENIKVLAIKIP